MAELLVHPVAEADFRAPGKEALLQEAAAPATTGGPEEASPGRCTWDLSSAASASGIRLSPSSHSTQSPVAWSKEKFRAAAKSLVQVK
jgi:hypothetical protein